MTAPRVTVLMSVYNGEKYLREAVDSIFGQTFGDFEFIIINDGSTDKTQEILDTYKDPRIVQINQDNMGLTGSLNKGLHIARGEYIARMDSDDISLPHRLERQLSFMDANPEIGICGSWVEIIGEKGESKDTWRYPTEPGAIRCKMLFESALAHPSVMMRRTLFLERGLCYNKSYTRSQDYELWVRASRYTSLANIGEVLLLYRLHTSQVGRQSTVEQQSFADQIRLEQLNELGIRPSEEEFLLHKSLSLREFRTDKDFIRKTEAWLIGLKDKNMEKKVYPEPALLQVIAERWFAACSGAVSLGLWSWNTFRQSPLSSHANLGLKQRIVFALRCVVGRNI